MSVIITPNTGTNQITIISDTGQVLVTTSTANEVNVRMEHGIIDPHNSLLDIQGGTISERYHLTKAQYDSLGGDGSFDFVSLTGDQTVSGIKTFTERPFVDGNGELITYLDYLNNPYKANRWSVPALRVNNFYTEGNFINIYQISSGQLFQGWGDITDIDPTYPIWQSVVDDTSQCLLYRDTNGLEKLKAPYLNQGNPIIGLPADNPDIPPWEKTWSGDYALDPNNVVQIDLVDKYQINSISNQPPANAIAGDSWLNNQNGKIFTYYVNPNETIGQWIQI